MEASLITGAIGIGALVLLAYYVHILMRGDKR